MIIGMFWGALSPLISILIGDCEILYDISLMVFLLIVIYNSCPHTASHWFIIFIQHFTFSGGNILGIPSVAWPDAGAPDADAFDWLLLLWFAFAAVLGWKLGWMGVWVGVEVETPPHYLLDDSERSQCSSEYYDKDPTRNDAVVLEGLASISPARPIPNHHPLCLCLCLRMISRAVAQHPVHRLHIFSIPFLYVDNYSVLLFSFVFVIFFSWFDFRLLESAEFRTVV